MPLREKPVERELLRRCRDSGLLCLKFTSPARRGVPDRAVIAPAGTVFVEVKRPGEGLRADQRAMHAKMLRFGAAVCTLSTIAAVAEFVACLAALPPSTGPELVRALESVGARR